MNTRIEHEIDYKLMALAHARKVFCDDNPAVDPPIFAPEQGLEDGLGRGYVFR